MSSTSENLKRQRRGVSTWNEQLKTISALMKEVLGGQKAESGLQLKIAAKLKDMGRIENPTRENVKRVMDEIRGVKSAPRPEANTPPKREPVELEEDSESESEQPKVVANNSKENSRMQKQGGGGCGCSGGADMMMKGGAGCGMLPLTGGKRRGRKATRKGRKATRKSRKATRKGRKGSRKSRTSRK